MKILPLVISALALSSPAFAQDIDKANDLNPGDGRDRVLTLLGKPGKMEKFGNQEALQYCKTTMGRALYVRVRLTDAQVVAVDRYDKLTDFVGLCKNGYDGTSFSK